MLLNVLRPAVTRENTRLHDHEKVLALGLYRLVHGTSCYRIMLGIKRLDFISNEEVLRQVQQEKLVQLILGHILKKPEDELANKYALYHPRHGKRKVGRPKSLFHQYIARVMCQDNPPTPEEIRLMALDRTNWGKLVADESVG